MNDILFLLSKDETELFTKEQLNFCTYWWLRTAHSNISTYVWYVFVDGSLDYRRVYDSYGGVRPAFKSEILNLSNYPETLEFGNFCGIEMKWILSKDKSLYLLNNYIVSSVFNFKVNDYENSCVRKVVKAMEKELLKAIKKENNGKF